MKFEKYIIAKLKHFHAKKVFVEKWKILSIFILTISLSFCLYESESWKFSENFPFFCLKSRIPGISPEKNILFSRSRFFARTGKKRSRVHAYRWMDIPASPQTDGHYIIADDEHCYKNIQLGRGFR